MKFGIVVALAASGLVSAGLTPAAPVPYPLVCRGGGAIVMALHRRAVAITFRPAAQGAGARPPRPGECAWLDRGWRANEAADVVWWVGDGIEVATRVRPVPAPDSSSIVNIEIEGDAGKALAYRYLTDAMQRASVFHLRVEQRAVCSEPGLQWAWERRMTFGRCFWVTRIGA